MKVYIKSSHPDYICEGGPLLTVIIQFGGFNSDHRPMQAFAASLHIIMTFRILIKNSRSYEMLVCVRVNIFLPIQIVELRLECDTIFTLNMDVKFYFKLFVTINIRTEIYDPHKKKTKIRKLF